MANMRKSSILLALTLIVLVTSQVATANAWYKRAWLISTGDGDRILETGENIVWSITIYVYNDGDSDMTDMVVTDNLGAEFEIDKIKKVTQGTVDWYTKGKSEKVHLTWDVGTLLEGEGAWLSFRMSTDLNPAGKQEFTSPGEYWLNSGPTAKWYVNGKKHSEEIPPIMITVLPQS